MLTKLISLSMFLSLILLPQAYAAGKVKKTKKKVVREEVETAEPDDTSKSIRNSKQGGVGVLYTPVSDFVLSYGAGGFYSYKPGLQLGGAFLMGSDTLHIEEASSTTNFVADAALSGMSFFGYGRYFFGNSFAAMAGLGYRSATIDYEIAGGGVTVTGSLKVSSIVIPFFIGNHWSWANGLTFGVDWIGVFVPISGSSESSLTGNIGQSTVNDLNNKFLELGDKLAKQSSLTVALTSVSWMF